MPQTSLMPPVKTQFLDNNGKPAAGGKVYTWMAGTNNSPKATYTDSTGEVENANPVTLDTNGRAAIWLSGYYHIQAYDALGNLIADADNVSSMPNTVVTQSQWVPQNITLTFVDGDNFSTPGILTDTFAVGQRVKATVSAGDIYGTVSGSTAGGSPVVTTVTVTWDSGELDSGLSAVWTGILTPGNPSIPGGVTLSDLQNLRNLLGPTSRTIGDIITKTSAGAMGVIAAAVAGNYFKSVGAATLPVWGKLSLSDTGTKIGFVSTTSSGGAPVVVTGIGFKPSVVIFLSTVVDDDYASFTIGLDNGTSRAYAGFWMVESSFSEGYTTRVNVVYDDDYSIYGVIDGASAVRGYISSMGSDGFTITKASSPVTGPNVLYLALP